VSHITAILPVHDWYCRAVGGMSFDAGKPPALDELFVFTGINAIFTDGPPWCAGRADVGEVAGAGGSRKRDCIVARSS
jgi:hypothetical protein